MSNLNCIQKHLLSAPENAPHLKHALINVSKGNYCSSKSYAFYAIILATFSAPLYVVMGLADCISWGANLHPGFAFKALVINLGRALKCIVIIAALVTCLALSILMPCMLSGFRQATPSPKGKVKLAGESDQDIWKKKISQVLPNIKDNVNLRTEISSLRAAVETEKKEREGELRAKNEELSKKDKELVDAKERAERAEKSLAAKVQRETRLTSIASHFRTKLATISSGNVDADSKSRREGSPAGQKATPITPLRRRNPMSEVIPRSYIMSPNTMTKEIITGLTLHKSEREKDRVLIMEQAATIANLKSAIEHFKDVIARITPPSKKPESSPDIAPSRASTPAISEAP